MLRHRALGMAFVRAFIAFVQAYLHVGRHLTHHA
jgi:hypothetical protein